MEPNSRWHVTSKQHAFMVKHQANITRNELTQKLNSQFGLQLNIDVVRSYTKRNKLNRVIKTMVDGEEQRRWIANNQAGMSRQQLAKSFNGTFGSSLKTSQLTGYCRRNGLQADEIIRNRKPIGTISRQGKFLCIKTANPDVWESMHRVQWESMNRKKIPDGYMIVFADGDCDNLSKDNLVCVHDSISIVINHRHRANTPSPKLNKAIMLTASLHALSKG